MALANRYVYYESSRGCPFRCAYCLSSRSDQRFEAKGIETVKHELGLILRHRPKLVKFVDRTFNMPGGRHREIWSFLIDRFGGGPTVFHFEIHPSHLDRGGLCASRPRTGGPFPVRGRRPVREPGGAGRIGTNWRRGKQKKRPSPVSSHGHHPRASRPDRRPPLRGHGIGDSARLTKRTGFLPGIFNRGYLKSFPALR